MKKNVMSAVFVTVALLLIIGCGGSKKDEKKILVWLGGEPGSSNTYTELIKEFQETQSDFEFETVFVGSSDFNAGLQPALSGGEGPDIFMAGTGPGQPAAFISGGLVLDLTPYYKEYGWKIPDSVLTTTSSGGKLWAVGDQVETTTMFYNKKLFAERDLTPPATEEEFRNILEVFKADSEIDTVIGLGGADKWVISHWQSMLFGAFASPAGVNEVMFGDGSWTAAPFVEAAAYLQNLAVEGYFGSSPNGVGYAESMDNFWAGKIPMTYTGPWIIADAVKKYGREFIDENFGVFLLPSPTGGKIYPTDSIGTGWYINAATRHPDEAAGVLNFLFFTGESRKRLVASGDSVVIGSIETILEEIDMPLLSRQVLDLKEQYRTNGFVPAFLDTVQPQATTDATYDALQALIASEITPEEFTETIQKSWSKDKSEGLILKPAGIN